MHGTFQYAGAVDVKAPDRIDKRMSYEKAISEIGVVAVLFDEQF